MDWIKGMGRKRQKFFGAIDIMNGELVEYGGKVQDWANSRLALA
jgi:hypothetical protein